MTVPEIKKKALKTYTNSISDCFTMSFIYTTMIVIIFFFEKMLLDFNVFIGIPFFWVVLLIITYLNLGLKSFYLNLASDRPANYYNLVEPKIGFDNYLLLKAMVLALNIVMILTFKALLSGKIDDNIIVEYGNIWTINFKVVNFWAVLTVLPTIIINLYLTQAPYLFLERPFEGPVSLGKWSFGLLFGRIIWFLLIIIDYFMWFGVRTLLLKIMPDAADWIVNYGMIFVLAFFTIPYVQISLGYFYRAIEKRSGWYEDDSYSINSITEREVHKIGEEARNRNNKDIIKVEK